MLVDEERSAWDGAREEVLVAKGELDDGLMVALGELAQVAQLAKVTAEDYDRRIRAHVLALRYPGGGDPTDQAPEGVSWAAIGESLGTTGEAARKRYGEWVDAEFQKMLREWALSVSGGDERWADKVVRVEEEG